MLAPYLCPPGWNWMPSRMWEGYWCFGLVDLGRSFIEHQTVILPVYTVSLESIESVEDPNLYMRMIIETSLKVSGSVT